MTDTKDIPLDPKREVPGFFIIYIDNEQVKPVASDPAMPWMPQAFKSLDDVNTWFRQTYGHKVPLRVIDQFQVDGIDMPTGWGAELFIRKKQVPIQVSYIGSFKYHSGRPVDPTKVGTSKEFN